MANLDIPISPHPSPLPFLICLRFWTGSKLLLVLLVLLSPPTTTATDVVVARCCFIVVVYVVVDGFCGGCVGLYVSGASCLYRADAPLDAGARIISGALYPSSKRRRRRGGHVIQGHVVCLSVVQLQPTTTTTTTTRAQHYISLISPEEQISCSLGLDMKTSWVNE